MRHNYIRRRATISLLFHLSDVFEPAAPARPPAHSLGVCCDRQRHAVFEAPGPFRIWSLPLPLCYSRLVSCSDDHHRPPLIPCPRRCHLLWLGGWEGRGVTPPPDDMDAAHVYVCVDSNNVLLHLRAMRGSGRPP